MKHIPLLAIIVIAYNVIAFLFKDLLATNVWSVTLMSGAKWDFSVTDLLLSLSVVLLYFELFKSTRTSSASIIDHLLSMLVFIVCLLEFIAVPQVGHSTFLIITLMCLLDVIAGFTITISTARRDFGIAERPIVD